MPRNCSIRLDETEFTVPALNIAQLQNVAEIIASDSPSKGSFSILKVAMERATPTADWTALAPTLDEIADAIAAILKMSGLQKPEANPQLTVVPITKSSV